MNEKIFGKENCPYGFKRPYCEEVCIDYEGCNKGQHHGKHEVVGLIGGFFKCSCGYSTQSPIEMRDHQAKAEVKAK